MTDIYCPYCLYLIEIEYYCHNTSGFYEDDVYCPNCGAKLSYEITFSWERDKR